MTRPRTFAATLLATLAAGPARAWETDQLTDRDDPLPDVTALANAWADALVDQAVERARERVGCDASDEEARFVLARELHAQVGRPEHVRGRSALRGRGYNVYGAALEETPGIGRAFLDRSDIYGDVRAHEGLLLSVAGVCSTVSIAGVRLGVDKLDHFFGMGFALWMRAGAGPWRQEETARRNPAAALAWSTYTERAYYGMSSSSTFSFADLVANWEGYRFYSTLLLPDSVVLRGADGRLARGRAFDWADWLDWRHDEVLNPPVYTRRVGEAVRRRLAEQRDAYCESYRRWGGADYARHLDEVLRDPPPAVLGEVPPRADPYGLDELCGAPAGQGT